MAKKAKTKWKLSAQIPPMSPAERLITWARQTFHQEGTGVRPRIAVVERRVEGWIDEINST